MEHDGDARRRRQTSRGSARKEARARRLIGPCRDLARRLVTLGRRPLARPALLGLVGQ